MPVLLLSCVRQTMGIDGTNTVPNFLVCHCRYPFAYVEINTVTLEDLREVTNANESEGGGNKTSDTYPLEDVHQTRKTGVLGDGGNKSEDDKQGSLKIRDFVSFIFVELIGALMGL